MRRPQFSLRTLLWLMVVVAISLTVARHIGGKMAEAEDERTRQLRKAEWEQRVADVKAWNAAAHPIRYVCGTCGAPLP